MNPIPVRKATRADVSFLADGNEAMAMETEAKTLDRARLSSGVLGLFNQPAFGFYVVAEVDGKAAGQLMITYEWSDWRNGLFWWIQSVHVVPEFRRQGLYRSMHEWVVAEAKRQGACGIRLYVEKENTGAHKTYTRCGMEPSHYRMFEQIFERSKY